MKNTHTPGPWSAAADGTQWKISTLAFANDQTDGPDNVGPVPLKGTLENARLIASAPDLLAVLSAIVSDYHALQGSQGASASLGSEFTAGEWLGSRLGGHIARAEMAIAKSKG